MAITRFQMLHKPEVLRFSTDVNPHFRDELFSTNPRLLFFISIYAGLNAVKTMTQWKVFFAQVRSSETATTTVIREEQSPKTKRKSGVFL